MLSTTDISKALRTAEKALAAGNLDTFRRSARYAERRLGARGTVAALAPEMAWRMLNATLMMVEERRAEERRVLYGR